MVTIIALRDGEHYGDNDNAQAVANSIEKTYKSALVPVEKKISHIAQHGALRDMIISRPDEEFIVVGAGAQSVETLAGLHNLHNVTTGWSGHVLPDILNKDARAQIDSIHVPEYATGHALNYEKNTHLVTTRYGVPTTASTETLQQAFNEENTTLLLPANQKVISVVLSGDNKAPDGTIRYYSADEAYALGQRAGFHAQQIGATVLATNSMKTGKYHPHTGQERNFVEDGELDAVSQAFLRGLAESGLSQYKQHFFDCRESASKFSALLGEVAGRTDCFALLPANSTSMLSSAAETLHPGTIIAYRTEAMQPVHVKQCDKLLTDGYIHTMNPLDENPAFTMATTLAKDTAPSAADTVAKDIINVNFRKTLQGLSAPASMSI